jgi:hypothetical protein
VRDADEREQLATARRRGPAFAPMASMSFCLSSLLLITVTACPFCTNSFVSGLLMFPNEPVITIFIFVYFLFLQRRATKKWWM